MSYKRKPQRDGKLDESWQTPKYVDLVEHLLNVLVDTQHEIITDKQFDQHFYWDAKAESKTSMIENNKIMIGTNTCVVMVSMNKI
jgi:hypothetical protein